MLPQRRKRAASDPSSWSLEPHLDSSGNLNPGVTSPNLSSTRNTCARRPVPRKPLTVIKHDIVKRTSDGNEGRLRRDEEGRRPKRGPFSPEALSRRTFAIKPNPKKGNQFQLKSTYPGRTVCAVLQTTGWLPNPDNSHQCFRLCEEHRAMHN